MAVFLLLSLLLNLYSFGFNVYVIWKCPYKYCGYIDVSTATNTTLSNNPLYTLSPETPDKFDDFQKFVFSSATLSGMISYVCMMYVLCTHFSVFEGIMNEIKELFTAMWKKFDEDEPDGEEPDGEQCDDSTRKQLIFGVQLNPFCDKANDGDSTMLLSKQSSYYNLVFLLNLGIFSASICIFFILFAMRYDRNDTRKRLAVDIMGLVSQFYSWFCAILSCFIFSKIAYAVINISYNQLYSGLKYVALQKFENKQNMKSIIIELQERMKFSIPNDEELNYLKDRFFNIPYLERLKEIDKWYTDTVKRSLQPFGTWFAVHWLTYTLSAFLSISYVIESALIELYGEDESDKKCHGEHNFRCRLTLSYIILFSIGHCILFLYPCFRAASVTAARFALIKKVSEAHWPNVSIEEKQSFIQYLKDKDCTFKVSILCANLSFGFNIAYFSIFVGIMGVVLKISL